MLINTYKNYYTQYLKNGGLSFLILIALASYFWWPALWDGKTILHADAAHHGLSLLSYHQRALAGEESFLWSSRIYGGHPLFSEGQGGFANPLNILSVALFDPVYASGFFHWLTMLIAGFGMYVLCRLLDISRWSATFASIAVIYSSIWLHFQYNLTVSATMAWVPWLLAAAEYWLKQPSIRRAVLLATPAALLVFSGYPHITHGAAVFIAATLVGELFQRNSRTYSLKNWKIIIATGLFAIFMAIILSAIQLLPLLELAGQSHRSEGTGLPFAGLIHPSQYLSGLFYFNLDKDNNALIPNSLGNLTVVILASLILIFKASSRLYGYAIGTILLFNLGMEHASPIFKFIYDNNLIPGLNLYRIMHPFFVIAVIGFSVLAAFSLDKLSNTARDKDKNQLLSKNILKITIPILMIISTASSAILINKYYTGLSHFNFATPLIILIATAVLFIKKKTTLIPALATLLLATDALMMRSEIFNFYDHSIKKEPHTVVEILKDEKLENYRTYDKTFFSAMHFLPAIHPDLQMAYQRYLEGLSPLPGLEWGIASFDGAFALPLARRVLIQPAVDKEITAKHEQNQKLRFIDVLGIKYISTNDQLESDGLSLFIHSEEYGFYIYKNERAQPRFQVYNNAVMVENAQEALAGLQSSDKNQLFIERPKRSDNIPKLSITSASDVPANTNIEIIESSSTKYHLKVDVEHNAWLFLADANYPGWEAEVNGQKQTVYSAQVLGKAVELQTGKNNVIIRYTPRSFYVGATISAIALLLAFIILVSTSHKKYSDIKSSQSNA